VASTERDVRRQGPALETNYAAAIRRLMNSLRGTYRQCKTKSRRGGTYRT
jgi:hypothetical protein